MKWQDERFEGIPDHTLRWILPSMATAGCYDCGWQSDEMPSAEADAAMYAHECPPMWRWKIDRPPLSAEQQARDMLERLGMDGAQELTSGDVVELANLIAEVQYLRRWCSECRCAR